MTLIFEKYKYVSLYNNSEYIIFIYVHFLGIHLNLFLFILWGGVTTFLITASYLYFLFDIFMSSLWLTTPKSVTSMEHRQMQGHGLIK